MRNIASMHQGSGVAEPQQVGDQSILTSIPSGQIGFYPLDQKPPLV